ncbi:MAG: domain S-box-containing protein [Frankiales bacterium]|nr:domain S-box-containing protein [Frankiales bacterium]
MPVAPMPAEEAARLRALRRLALFETEPEQQYDDLAAMVAELIGVPTALFSLVGEDTQYFKARVGFPVSGSDRAWSLCAYQVLQDTPLVVPDASLDPRFSDNPLVLGDLHLRAYLGAPVTSPDGQLIGSLCAVDYVPRQFTPEQVEKVALLARQASALVELRQTQLNYRAALSASAQVIVHLDADGSVLALSGGWDALGCGSADDVVGRPLAQLVHPPDHALLDRLLLDGTVGGAELRLCRTGGGEVWTSLRLTPLLDEQGRLLGHVGTVMDLTEHHQAEVETRHAQKLEALGRLSAGLAHEINTPIQFVGDNTRFLADAYDSMLGLVGTYRSVLDADVPLSWQERKDRVADAEREADLAWLEQEVPTAVRQSLEGVDRVASLVRAMKSFSYKDQDLPEPADLNEALRTTVTVARNETKYVADVELDLGAIPPVRCLVGDLNQVVLNLLVNAADALQGRDRRGLIRVSTRLEGDSVVVRVQDDGPGVPEEIRDRVFEPFFTTKGVGRGTGQGLALARTVVQDRHHGQLQLVTPDGGGACFVLRLPVAGPALTQEAS